MREKFNAKIAIVYLSIDSNRESEAKKESVKRIKMRKTNPPTRCPMKGIREVIKLGDCGCNFISLGAKIGRFFSGIFSSPIREAGKNSV